jgi:UDP-N-acetylglucosamine acyltransferase
MKPHPTALVDPAAAVADDVEIGPFCLVGPGVRIGPGCRLIARVSINGPVGIGRGNVFHPNAVIGSAPQSVAPAAPGGRIQIGDDNTFREGVTVNLPSAPNGVTEIGSRNRFHASSHVGHDCVIGNDNLVGSFAALAGHTMVYDEACIEGSCLTNSHVQVGRGGWLQSHSKAGIHVPPFMGVGGDRAEVRAITPRFRTPALERAFQILWKSDLALADALQKLEGETAPEIVELVEFLRRPPLETSS